MNVKVKLKDDLIKYHPTLKKGIIGETTTLNSINDCYVKVRFPDMPLWDIIWKSLEIIDEEFLLKKKKEEEDILQAEYVEMVWGPSGGFKRLEITSKKRIYNAYSSSDREEGLRILKKLKQRNVPIHEVGKPNERNRMALNE